MSQKSATWGFSEGYYVHRTYVVVVDIELGSGIGLAGGFEGNADEVLAEDVVEG